jgi:hypothetical protein
MMSVTLTLVSTGINIIRNMNNVNSDNNIVFLIFTIFRFVLF